VSDNYDDAKSSEIVIIAVPTPLNSDRMPDITYIESACNSLVNIISPGTLIINESTSFPGTLRKIIATILGNQMLYASAPERVDPGNNVWNIRNTPRIIGGLNDEALAFALNFYKSICDSVISVSSPEVAEAAKLFENTFRQVNIALVNEFAIIANSLNISVFETLDAANSKPFGIMKFLPGIGVGGHCIPVDPIYLSYVAAQSGVKAEFIELANKTNRSMTQYVVSRLEKDFEIKNMRIQIAGISYKSNVSDTRESPVLDLIHNLRERGAIVIWHDEFVKAFNGESSEPLMKVDLGIIATAHDNVDYSPWRKENVNVLNLSHKDVEDWQRYL
jgi:UDP-N-acetyl-D-glucosamine dehydrogenase